MNFYLKILKNNYSTTRISFMDFEFPEDDLNKIKKRTDNIDTAAINATFNPIVKGAPISTTSNSLIKTIKKPNRRYYTKEDDELIVNYVKLHGYNNQTFDRAAIELNKSRGYYVKQRYDKLMKDKGIELPPFEKIKYKKRNMFSEVEDKIIKEHVIMHGYSNDTFRNLGKELGRPRWDTIRQRFDLITIESDVHEEKNEVLERAKFRQIKRFTKEEDKKIIDYVEKFGYNQTTFKNLANELQRTRPHRIRERHNLITSEKSETSKIRRDWSIQEDEMLLRYMIKVTFLCYL